MKWRCKSCKQLQKDFVFGFLFNNNINCDKCIEFDKWIKEQRNKKFIKDRDSVVSVGDK